MGDALISETFLDGHYISQFKHKGSVLKVVCGMSQEDFEVLLGLAGSAFRSMKDSANAISYKEALEKEVGKVKSATEAEARRNACTLEGDLRAEFRIKEAEYERTIKAKVGEKEELSRQLEATRTLSLTTEASLQAARGQLGGAERIAWEKYEKEVAKIKSVTEAEARRNACTLEGDLRTQFRIKEAEYERTIKAKVSEKEELFRQLEATRALSLTADASLQAARGQLGEAEKLAWEKYEKILAKSEEKVKETIKERLEQNAAQHNKAYLELKEIYDKETAKLRKENDKSHVSSEKGKQGEREFEDVCAEHTGWGELKNTSKEAAATDRRGTIKGCPTMFEIKKYKENVPTKEVLKFQRDMKENPSSPFGVFVSLTSDICNKLDSYVHIEWTENYQLLMYINHLYSHPIPETMEFIETCAGIAQSVYKSAKSKVDSETSVALMNRIEQVKFLIHKELASVAEGIKAVEQYKANLVNTITNQHNDLKRIMNTSKETLQAMVGILIGKEEDSSSLETVSPKDPKKPRAKKIDAKAK